MQLIRINVCWLPIICTGSRVSAHWVAALWKIQLDTVSNIISFIVTKYKPVVSVNVSSVVETTSASPSGPNAASRWTLSLIVNPVLAHSSLIVINTIFLSLRFGRSDSSLGFIFVSSEHV